jgi:hypothetical protein
LGQQVVAAQTPVATNAPASQAASAAASAAPAAAHEIPKVNQPLAAQTAAAVTAGTASQIISDFATSPRQLLQSCCVPELGK